MKSTTYSLFTNLLMLERMKEKYGYKFDYTLDSGTLIAQMRHEKMFAWDSDSDIGEVGYEVR